MNKRRHFQLALIAALAAATTGCAGKSMFPTWGGSKSGSSASSLDDLAAQNAAKNSSPSMFSKSKSALASPFSSKPKQPESIEDSATSLNTKPKKIGADLYVSAARVHELRGNYDAAIEQYQKAIEASPKDVSALVGLARLYDRQENFVEAEKLYRRATQADANSAMAWNDFGLCYARQKKLANAAAALENAISLQPKNAMYRNNLATVLVESGRADEAFQHLSATSGPAIAHYNLGFLLNQRQQHEQAARHLQMALQANPDLAPAAELLAQINGEAGTLAEVVIETPSHDSPSYTVSDEIEEHEEVYVANANSPAELVNPLAPATRRSATYRMPPTSENSSDPAPPPSRLPVVSERPAEEAATELELTRPAVSPYPTTRATHVDSGIRQPNKNVIRLLGSEPLSAPIPQGE